MAQFSETPFDRIVGVHWRSQTGPFYVFGFNGTGSEPEAYDGEHDTARAAVSRAALEQFGFQIAMGPVGADDAGPLFSAFEDYNNNPGVLGAYVLRSDVMGPPFEEWDLDVTTPGFLPYGVAAGVNAFGTPNINCPPPFYFHGNRQATLTHCEAFSEYAREGGSTDVYELGSHSICEYERFGGGFTVLSCS